MGHFACKFFFEQAPKMARKFDTILPSFSHKTMTANIVILQGAKMNDKPSTHKPLRSLEQR